MARTTSARLQGTEPHQDIITSDRMSYTEELLDSNHHMDSVRAQQLENWAEQRELSTYNKYMYYDKDQETCEMNINAHNEVSLRLEICIFIIPWLIPNECILEGILSFLASCRGWWRIRRHDIIESARQWPCQIRHYGELQNTSTAWFELCLQELAILMTYPVCFHHS